jgi:hypothetical protein
MKPSRVTTRLLLLALAFFSAATARATDLTGTTVFGEIISKTPGLLVTTQFSPSAVVGPGVEFNGVIDLPGLLEGFNISADFGADDLTIVFSSHEPFANVQDSDGLLDLSFIGFPPSLDFEHFTHTCDASVGAYCPNTPEGLQGQFTSTGEMDFVFISLFSGDTYVFNNDPPVTPGSPVPEPSTFALLGTGALGFAGALRRRFSPASSTL